MKSGQTFRCFRIAWKKNCGKSLVVTGLIFTKGSILKFVMCAWWVNTISFNVYIALTCTETSFAVSERLCLALKSPELTWNWPAELIKELQELPNSWTLAISSLPSYKLNGRTWINARQSFRWLSSFCKNRVTANQMAGIYMKWDTRVKYEKSKKCKNRDFPWLLFSPIRKPRENPYSGIFYAV